MLVIPSTFAPDNPQAIDQDVDKLGKPKPGQSGKDPPQGKPGEGEARAAQGQANQGKQDPKVKEAGKGAKKGVESCGRRAIPTVGFGPGDERLAHQIDERIAVADIQKAAASYTRLLRAIVRPEAKPKIAVNAGHPKNHKDRRNRRHR